MRSPSFALSMVPSWCFMEGPKVFNLATYVNEDHLSGNSIPSQISDQDINALNH